MLVSQLYLKWQVFRRKLKLMSYFDCVKFEMTFLNSSYMRLDVLNKFEVNY